jgi:hypothetical protein
MTKPVCSGHLQPRLPSCRCKSPSTPQNQYGRRDEKKYPCPAGNWTTLNGSVIILPRYPSPQRAGRSRSLIPVGVKLCAPAQNGPGTHPASVQWLQSPFPGGKAAGTWFWSPLAPTLKAEYSYTSTPPLSLHGLFRGERSYCEKWNLSLRTVLYRRNTVSMDWTTEGRL